MCKYQDNYVLGDDGMLYAIIVTYPDNGNLEEMNYNKYLNAGGDFAAKNKIYTRHKFLSLPNEFKSYSYGKDDVLEDIINNIDDRTGRVSDLINNFTYSSQTRGKEKNTFYLYTESGDPNNAKGYKTKFCEASKVVLSGHFYKFNGSWSEHAKAGSFSIE